MTQAPCSAAELRLHSLRRLYHHVVHGGTTNQRDANLLGAEPTAANLAAEIERLERVQRREMTVQPPG